MDDKYFITLKSKITLTDIANEIDVSPATVSLVLRSKPGVSPETRQRVLDAAQTLGYVFKPSSHAQGQLTVTDIGLIIKARPDDIPMTNNFYVPVMSGIEMVCRKNRINLLYGTIPVDKHNTPLELPRLLTEQIVDGLLLVGAFVSETTMNILEGYNLPVVLVDAYAATNPYDAVVTDNTAGAYEAVTYLIAKGHQHIGIVGSEPDAYPSILERRTGYLKALQDKGLQSYFADCLLRPEFAEPATVQLLQQHPQITAIFGCNDDVAIAAMQAARDLGRQLPQDLSVVGFDNIALAQRVWPSLTTIRVDKMGMGRLAAQMLINRIEYSESAKVRAVIVPYLIERASVAPI